MANGLRNALLFGGGALMAALVVAYGAGVFSPAPVGDPAVPTAENSSTSKEGRIPAGADKGGNQPAVGQEKAASDSAPAVAKADVTAPTFDVVRVESDGSIVVAGKAAPNARVEILSGSSVIATSDAGPEGDFASVLDDPLKPGDYQLVLRSTTSQKVVAMSKQTAVVSIPEHPDGQVLALVEQPGEPSRLITVPKAQAAGGQAASGAAAGSPAGGGSSAPASQGKPGGSPAPGSQMAATPPQSSPGPAADQPSADKGAKGRSPASAGGQPAEPQGAAGGSAGGGTATPKNAPPASSQEVARTEGGAGSGVQPAANPPSVAPPKISVEAVEIEGNKIFVAGVADPGTSVRIYANDTALGEAKTSPVGRFLVEAIHELAVGDYIIRADMLASDGSKVIARAAVPFTREAGESVAAVASSVEQPSGTVVGAPAASGGSNGDAAAGRANTPQSGRASGAAANAGSAAAGSADGGRTTATGPSGNGTAAPGGSGSPAATTEQGGATPAAPGGAAGGATETAAGEAGTLPPLNNAISQEPPTILAPRLQETSGAVIIRRGDTLWRISRRVYGHGVRYTTIYLANQDQIEDPDRIWPGQIFSVPDKTKQGEAADMKAIGDQATQMPKPASQ